jgi:Fe-coproporphyrin III synthase
MRALLRPCHGCGPAEDELSTAEGRRLIDDLAHFGVPVLLFSGGEPLVRKDLPDLAAYAVEKGMRAVISTNGTLIDRATAQVLKNIGLSYVGISLDGLEPVNDRFRGVKGALTKPCRPSAIARKPASKWGCALR